MADKTVSKNVLSLEMEFVDGDTRTINLDNPKATVTAEGINSLGAYAAENGLVIGDKEGAAFSRFKSAKTISRMTTYLDLND